MSNLDNINAMTGMAYQFDIDIDRGFYSNQVIGSIDAPGYVPAGSTIENVITNSRCGMDGRYIIANIESRG